MIMLLQEQDIAEVQALKVLGMDATMAGGYQEVLVVQVILTHGATMAVMAVQAAALAVLHAGIQVSPAARHPMVVLSVVQVEVAHQVVIAILGMRVVRQIMQAAILLQLLMSYREELTEVPHLQVMF